MQLTHPNLGNVTTLYACVCVFDKIVFVRIVRMSVCMCVCMRYGRSPEVIRPPAKCYFFLWGMVTVGQRDGVH